MTLFLNNSLTIALFLTGSNFRHICLYPWPIFSNSSFIMSFIFFFTPIGIIGTAFSKNISASNGPAMKTISFVIPRILGITTTIISSITTFPLFIGQSQIIAFFNQFGIGAILQILARFFTVNNIIPFLKSIIIFIFFNQKLISSFKILPSPDRVTKIKKIMLVIEFSIRLISRKNRYKDN